MTSETKDEAFRKDFSVANGVNLDGNESQFSMKTYHQVTDHASRLLKARA